MDNHSEVLKQQLSEQIALEEHLCKIIEEQLSEIDEVEFADARVLLSNTCKVLERHFTPLNRLLDKLDEGLSQASQFKAEPGNGNGTNMNLQDQRSRRISKILRDDYSALNLITISNTLLHTTALALDSKEIADTALSHLENLTPLVVQIGELMPEVVARELQSESSKIDLGVAQTALKNARLAWRKAS